MDPVVFLIETLLKLYNWAGQVLTYVLMHTVFKDNPEAEGAARALGAAFNMLVNLTAFYIALKVFTKFEKILLYIIVAGWAILVALMAGMLSPDVASELSRVFG